MAGVVGCMSGTLGVILRPSRMLDPCCGPEALGRLGVFADDLGLSVRDRFEAMLALELALRDVAAATNLRPNARSARSRPTLCAEGFASSRCLSTCGSCDEGASSAFLSVLMRQTTLGRQLRVRSVLVCAKLQACRSISSDVCALPAPSPSA